jgi:GNAT superfamily N-acetyltransferase
MDFTRSARLTQDHELELFNCGDDAMSDWLRRFAFTSDRAGMCSVYVSTPPGQSRVAGYYGLATAGVSSVNAADRITKGVGRYDIPVILLARLAVDREFQGMRLGQALLKDALNRILNVSDQVGVRAVLIHCLDEPARAFYMNFAEFEPSPTDPMHLQLLLKDLKKAFGAG